MIHQGVYLHILADTGGSVAVIMSSIVIHYLGWHWVDPFCSLLLAALIFTSTLPLLSESTGTIVQRTPEALEETFQVRNKASLSWVQRECRRLVLKEALDGVLAVDGVVSYSDAHSWELKSGTYVASLRVQVRTGPSAGRTWRRSLLQVTSEASEQAVAAAVTSLLRGLEVKYSCVQVEKEAFANAIPGLLPSYPLPNRISKRNLSESLFVRAT